MRKNSPLKCEETGVRGNLLWNGKKDGFTFLKHKCIRKHVQNYNFNKKKKLNNVVWSVKMGFSSLYNGSTTIVVTMSAIENHSAI